VSAAAFLTLRRAFFDAHLADEPEDATLLGVPGHDDRLRDSSPSGEDTLRARCQVVLDDLDEYVPEDSLSPPLRAERWALRTYALHHLRPPARVHLEPLLLPYAVIQHQIARISDDPVPWQDVAARLRGIPEYLRSFFAVLSDHPSGRPLDRGLVTHFFKSDELVDAAYFLSAQLPALAPASVREELATAAETAADAYCWIGSELPTLPQADAFDLGEEEVAWRLSRWYGLGPADEHIAAATDELRSAQSDLVTAADRWSRGETGPAVTDLSSAMAAFRTVAARRLTDPSQAIPLYRRATERALTCIRAHDLFILPDPLHLAFWPTPPAIRRVVTQATNWPAPLMRPGPAGFLVTEDPAAHPIAGAANLAVHEGIPGHALHSLSWRQCFGDHPEPVAFLGLADDLAAARDFWAPHLNIEGWAVYCEHVMHEHGLLAADEALFFHVSRAIRALRVILDLDLARGRLTREAAAARLAEETAMPLAWSEGQVLRYTRIPLQAATYRLGYLAFADLQRRCRAAWGPHFNLIDFHGWALSWPPVPPARLDPADNPHAT
jgi:hypothetical protein